MLFSMRKPALFTSLFSAGLLCLLSFRTAVDDGPSPAKTPEQELATFQLDPGLKIQLVAAEPLVQDPVNITFDPDGRLWVVEMRGFMPTIDGKGESERVGRISILEDTDGDGRMDASTIFLDSLIMPRALGLVPGGALVSENKSLWLAEDLNGDSRADRKTLIDPDYAKNGLPEHSDNGLWRNIDNWYYNVKSRFRYKLTNGKWVRDCTEFRGQWGVSHDDKGRLIYNYNWSQLHGDLVPANYLGRNKHHTPTTGIDHGLTVDRRIYPIRANPAVNRGYIPGTLDKEGRLLEFTAACSPLSYRSNTLPAAYRGNIFVCEPAGNLVKRNRVSESGLLLNAEDPSPGREFLASTDERFRPVHLATGPDGALYVADMYRGLVQHGAYITPYLREQTLNRKLVLPIHCGRIWRIVPENWQASRPKKLSTAPSTELVRLLSAPDGWNRDNAQRLLVERGEASICPALEQVVQKGPSALGRFHALWTLEGLGQLRPELLMPLLSDASPLIRANAVRLLEPFAKADPSVRTRLEAQLARLAPTAPVEQALQMALTAEVLDAKASLPLLAGLVERHGDSPLIRDAVMSSLQDREFALLRQLWASPRWQAANPSKEIFLETLATSVVRKRDPAELKALLALLESAPKTLTWRQNAVLAGMTTGAGSGKGKAVQLAAAPALLTRGTIEPARLTALTSLFEWPGHATAASSLAKKTPLSADDQKQFALGRQHYLTTCAGCHGTDGGGLNRFAPPLNGSDWVTGDEKRLTLIILHGMEGAVEVAGKRYDAPAILPVMPAHSTMDDANIAAILTYIRNAWSNSAPAVSRRTVGMTRVTSQGRVMPWKAAELNKYVSEAKVATGN